MMSAQDSPQAIAVIGMAGRFPGAPSLDAYWDNLRRGIESITHFPPEELEDAYGRSVQNQPGYVRARSILDGVELFDAGFFNFLPREAELTDPQQRVFLEIAWEALESAGYDPAAFPGEIAVYAGSSFNTYLLYNVLNDRQRLEAMTGSYQVGEFLTLVGNGADFLATRTAYKLDLRGPAFTVQSACSTSLLAVAEACQCLLDYRADMALAGGVSITFPQKRGYLHQEGGMVSPDGHCRAFDARAAGTVFGSGAGVVLLKRLDAALADGDPIRAVIRGSAVNNDGARKVGYTAPSSDGQAKAVALAHAVADITAGEISYVECHGTATPLGDPIEIAGLAKAFGATTNRKGFCAIGTVKTNIGHLDIASGAAGLIKTILALEHESLPAALHFETPNPKLGLEEGPFFVNAELRPWPRGAKPRIAGVNAAGVGGTNVHLVVEEAPALPAAAAAAPDAEAAHLFVVSARDETALADARSRLAAHLDAHPEQSIGDVAFTLQTGRRGFAKRFAAVANDRRGLIEKLGGHGKAETAAASPPRLAFLFPGQGAQYPGMGHGLYLRYPVFARAIDQCAAILEPSLGLDLRTALFSGAAEAGPRLQATALAQPALFSVSFSVAALWRSLGFEPAAMLGHSIGEFVAATLSGVMQLEDALEVVALRGAKMQELPEGAMLAVMLPEAELKTCLPGDLSIAAVNSTAVCVVSGPHPAIDAFEANLTARGAGSRRLRTSHAFHSAMVDPVIEPLAKILARIPLRPPSIPYVSTLSGTWITDDQATDPLYWARHCRETVRYAAALNCLAGPESPILIEVGPGRTLTGLARQNDAARGAPLIAASLPDAAEERDADAVFLATLGRLWAAGAAPDWRKLHEGAPQRRVVLPTYPFQRKRYFIDAPSASQAAAISCEGSSITAMANETLLAAPAAEIGQQPLLDRQAAIRAELTALLENLSGIDIASAPPGTSFLELGFDSLFLTQASQAIKTRFNAAVSFRQMMGELSTVNAVAEYLDRVAENFVVEAAPAAPGQIEASPATPPQVAIPAPGFAAVSGLGQGIEQVMAAQLASMTDLINRQLETLRQMGGGASLTAAPFAAAAPAVRQTPQAAAPLQAKPLPGKTSGEAFGPFKPISQSRDAGLDAGQRGFVADLVERYTRRTRGSKEMTQASRAVLADPRVAAGFNPDWKEIVYPIVTVRSEGSKLWDVDGNIYVDLLNGFGPTAFGHAPDFVRDALIAQIEKGFELGPQTPLAGEVAKLFCDLTGNERMTFCNTGSEAVMAAMRIARTVTGRSRIVYFAGDYHGQFDEVLARGGVRDGVSRVFPIAPGIPAESIANITILDYGTPESLAWLERHVHELAAVLVEPVQSRRPDFRPRQFLKALRDLTAKAGTALIFDEIVTGFRVHPGGVQALFGIRADLVTYGKVAGGGMPIGILAGKAAFMDALDGGYWQYGDDSYPEAGVTFFAGTFVRHPLTLAATAAVLRYLKAAGPSLQERLSERTGELVDELNAVFERHLVPTEIHHFGSIFFLKFAPEYHFASLFYYLMREQGIHIQEGFPCFLTTAHDDADLAKIVAAFDAASAQMMAAGLFGPTPEKAGARQGQLTESQMEIWLSAQLGDAASCAFNESVTLDLRGPLDTGALRKAARDLVQRHEALRIRFAPSGDGFTVLPAAPLVFTIAARGEGEAEPLDARLADIIESEASTPFDLVNGPLIRFTLVPDPGQDRHMLVMTAHHIVCDGWSTNILMEELGVLYSARLSGAAASLPEAHSFVAYAARHGGVQPEAEAYWLHQFAQPPEPLALPLDHPRPALKSFRGDTLRGTIEASLYERVKQAASRNGCTLFAVLLTAYQLLLARLSGQTDIVAGIPTAGQSLHGDGPLVGHCVNFLPLRGEFPDGVTFLDAARKTQQLLLDAADHQSYTFGSLVRALDMPREINRLPLIEAQFNLERIGQNLPFHDLAVSAGANPKRFVNFDLFFNVVAEDRGLIIDCDYSTDLFESSTISRWIGHYKALLEAAAFDMNREAMRLPMLTKAEENALHSVLSGPECPIPELAVHELIDLQAAATPDAVAIRFENATLTYRELISRADRVAWRLLAAGVARETPVAIYLDRSAELPVAMLAVLKAGGAYVPLDPIYPQARIHAIISEADVKIALTSATLEDEIKAAIPVCIGVGEAGAELADEQSPPLPRARPTDLAYRIFTSGSTGRPKGIDVEHRAVVNLLTAMRQSPGISATDVFLAVTTPCFDIAALELFLPLTAGAELVIASRADVMDPFYLAALIARSSTTMMQATPALWRLLLEAGLNPKGLKILCGGEALDRKLAEDLGSGELWNMYGPTETTIWSLAERQNGGAIDFGRPIANTGMYILDAAGNTAAIGAAGELCISGAGLARGYHKNQALTQQSFAENPFSGGANGRLYRTGDRARYLANGRFELLGRADSQIKLRGFRIELGDVEDALRRVSGQPETAAVLRGDDLVGYIAAPEGSALSMNRLRTKLREELPDYMVPAHIMRLAALPRTQNGKINRKALPQPDFAQALQERTIAPPQTPLEAKLATIWGEVLRTGEIGIHDNLFALGADSIDLFRIAARMREQDLGLDAAQLMRHPTIAELAVAANDLAGESLLAPVNTAPSLQSFRRRAGAVR
ncbi:MAG: amino acid adenylation domain-containing protein [Beijerinckiaceae bacterium]